MDDRREPSTVSLRAVAVAAGVIAGGIAVALAAAAALLAWSGAPANGANEARPPVIHGVPPVLDGPAELERFRRAKARELRGLADPHAGVSFEQRPGAALPMALKLRDERGGRSTLGEALGGRPGIVVLGYAGCSDLCATTLPGIAEALSAARLEPARDYRAVFVSVDPRDSAKALGAMAQRIPTASRAAWRFGAGEEGGVTRLAAAIGFRYRALEDRFAHPAGFVVVTPQGRVSSYFFGVRFPPAEVAAALRTAAKEGEGGLAAPLLLLCAHLDPSAGRHSAAILGTLRASAFGGFAALALWAWRRRRAP